MKFTELKLNEKLMQGITETGYLDCMPVQEETLVHTLAGRDVEVQSQTGTGKTAAFLITIFQHFMDANSPIKEKKALIIAPTRELAIQIEKEARQIGRYLDFKIGCFYGGVGYQQQETLLEDDVDLIIGTPGRLLDFNQQGKMNFRDIGFFVIDEADRMLDMGFLPDIRKMLRRMEGNNTKKQIMLFSATLDVETRSIAREFMNNPATIEITPEQVTVDKITQILYHVAEREKMSLMLGILKKEMPNTALIFTNMKHTAAQVAKQLEYNGYKCQYLSGDLPQAKRLNVINAFKSGKLSFLVATDVAARGLHIDDLEMIINYDLPGDCENYVHRIGRTARAGKSGKAISLACERYIFNLEPIETFINMKIPVGIPDDDMFHVDQGPAMDNRRVAKGGSRSSRTHEKVPHKKSTSGAKRLSTKPAKKSSPEPEKSDNKTDSKTDRQEVLKHKVGRGSYKDRYKMIEKPKNQSPETPTDTAPETKPTANPVPPQERKFSKDKNKNQDHNRDKNRDRNRNKYPDKEKDKKTTDTPKDRKDTSSNRSRYSSSTKKKGENQPTPKTEHAKDKIATYEDRIEYYRKKYGDNFHLPTEKQTPPPPQPVKKSLLQKITSIFKRNKG